MPDQQTIEIEFALAYDPEAEDIDYGRWKVPWSRLPRASRTLPVALSLASAGWAGAELLVPAARRLPEQETWGYELGLFTAANQPPALVKELDVVDSSGWARTGRRRTQGRPR